MRAHQLKLIFTKKERQKTLAFEVFPVEMDEPGVCNIQKHLSELSQQICSNKQIDKKSIKNQHQASMDTDLSEWKTDEPKGWQKQRVYNSINLSSYHIKSNREASKVQKHQNTSSKTVEINTQRKQPNQENNNKLNCSLQCSENIQITLDKNPMKQTSYEKFKRTNKTSRKFRFQSITLKPLKLDIEHLTQKPVMQRKQLQKGKCDRWHLHQDKLKSRYKNFVIKDPKASKFMSHIDLTHNPEFGQIVSMINEERQVGLSFSSGVSVSSSKQAY